MHGELGMWLIMRAIYRILSYNCYCRRCQDRPYATHHVRVTSSTSGSTEWRNGGGHDDDDDGDRTCRPPSPLIVRGGSKCGRPSTALAARCRRVTGVAIFVHPPPRS
uniref:Uncharacterized protein n=1 Tax=Ixodes scapularis TaxID=6945 RepID=A0A4D5RCC6_IXOSC